MTPLAEWGLILNPADPERGALGISWASKGILPDEMTEPKLGDKAKQ